MDLFSTNILTGVVNSLQGIGPNSLVNKFFPGVQTETAEEIHFDVEADVMGLAPFVSPVVEGKAMTELGFTTKTFKPAYIKPKNVFDANRGMKRVIGEALTGSMSPQDRMRVLVANQLTVHRKQIQNRLEWMASSVLRTGAVTVVGDLYPSTAVSYSRDAACTVTLTGGNRWGQTGVKVLDSLQDWADTVMLKSGSVPLDVVMEIGAWKQFRVDADVVTRLNNQRALGDRPTMGQSAINQQGLTLVGSIDGFNIWLYQGLYKDDNGAVQRHLPSGTVIMVGDLMGYQAFGAIQDEEAGIQALPYFSKSWLEKDPGRRMVMTQSAPLVVPYRPNASLCATVL